MYLCSFSGRSSQQNGEQTNLPATQPMSFFGCFAVPVVAVGWPKTDFRDGRKEAANERNAWRGDRSSQLFIEIGMYNRPIMYPLCMLQSGYNHVHLSHYELKFSFLFFIFAVDK